MTAEVELDGREDRLGTVEGARTLRGANRLGGKRPDVFGERGNGMEETDVPVSPSGVESSPDAEDQFFEAFRDSLNQSVLPDLPRKPGFHTVWLTTTNPRDTIANRLRMGYTLIRQSELGPDWESLSAKTGDFAGVVAVNEMVAARLPLGLYNRIMREVHDRQPFQEEEKLKSNVEDMRDQAEARGSRVTAGDGTDGLGQRARPMPDFSY